MPLFNIAAQLSNHSFFWQCLAPIGSTKPSEKLLKMIERDFGSQQNLLRILAAEAVGHFASGWTWLIIEEDKLRITSLLDADTPIVNGMTPLLTLDI